MFIKPLLLLCSLLLSPHTLLGNFAIDPNANTAVVADNRNNYCELYNKINQGKLNRLDALKGVYVSVGIFADRTNQNTGKLNENHLPFKVFDEVARRAQFHYKDSYGIFAIPEGNETYTDKLLDMVSNYDVAVSWWIRTPERTSLGISGTKGWYDSSTIMIKNRDAPTSTRSYFSAFKPFDWSLWILILFTAIISGIVYHLIGYLNHKEDKNKRDPLGDNLFNTCLAFTGHSNQNPLSCFSRIIILSIAILNITLIASYEANLASNLIISKQKVTINTFQDAISNNNRICVYKASGDTAAIKNDYPLATYVDKESELEVYQGLANGDCEIGLTHADNHKEHELKFKYNPNCRLEVVGAPVRPGTSSFALMDSATLCSSVVRHVLDYYLLQMIEDGKLESIKTAYYIAGGDGCDSRENENKIPTSFSASSLAGIFIIYYIVLIVAITLAVLKAKYPRYFVRNLHELSLVRNGLSFMRWTFFWCWAEDANNERHREERVQKSDVIDIESGLGASDIVEGISTSDSKLSQTNQMIKELHKELHKEFTRSQNELKSEIIKEMKTELKKLT